MSSFTQQPTTNCFQLNIGSGEDRYVLSDNIYAVFDGHGGNIVSELLSKKIVEILEPKLNSIDISNNDEITDAVITAFKEADEYVLSLTYYRLQCECGSTCSMVIKLDKKLVMINLGDSNTILFVNGVKKCEMPMHLYSNPEEKVRVDSLVESGDVSVKQGYAPKVLNDKDITMCTSNLISLNKTMKYVVPTKNFGHVSWKKYDKMDVKPYINIVDIVDENDYECAIVTDGILDMLVDCDELYPLMQKENQAQNIVEFAKSRWEQEWNYKIEGCDDTPCQKFPNLDDMTAIYLMF